MEKRTGIEDVRSLQKTEGDRDRQIDSGVGRGGTATTGSPIRCHLDVYSSGCDRSIGQVQGVEHRDTDFRLKEQALAAQRRALDDDVEEVRCMPGERQ